MKKIYLWVIAILRKFRTKMRILKQFHSAEKCKRRDVLGFLKLQFVAKYQKIEGGPFGDKKTFAQCRKIQRTFLVPGFVSYVKN